MFTTTVPVYPGKVRGWNDQLLKNVNIVVFLGIWACLIVVINDVAKRAKRTVDDFWVPSGHPTVADRLRQRLDVAPCEYRAELSVGDFSVMYNISAANRELAFAEAAGLIRLAIFASCTAVFLSMINRTAFNYNWHWIRYGEDSNFLAPKGYLLMLEVLAIIWAIVALAQPQTLCAFLDDYIRHCGGDDIPHLFEAPPFVVLFIAFGVLLLAYALNWAVYLLGALRPVRKDVKAAWQSIEQVLAEEAAPLNAYKRDQWVVDGLPGRPLVEHAEQRLKLMLYGRGEQHGFPAVRGLQDQLWEAHGFGKKRTRRTPANMDDLNADGPGELRVGQLLVRDCADPAVNGTYHRMLDPPEGGWPPEVAAERGVWTNHDATARTTRYLFWLLIDPELPDEGGDCWILYDRLGHPARDPRGPPQGAGRTVYFAYGAPSPVGLKWESAEGAGASAVSVVAEVVTPSGAGIVVRPAALAASSAPEAPPALPNHWWVSLEGVKGPQESAGALSPRRGDSAEVLLARSLLRPRVPLYHVSPLPHEPEGGEELRSLTQPLRRDAGGEPVPRSPQRSYQMRM
eukprot:TRINITY_DN60073_c0_g1_i1.p1 TRINITY_DN60073_c0_g1~~TRINITY_DN60073_c0_g1_i1.p1  ORF type:complete len:596 (+),score=125.26 TRINITY_DN60073_c0_g1_i1:82-1788(+)